MHQPPALHRSTRPAAQALRSRRRSHASLALATTLLAAALLAPRPAGAQALAIANAGFEAAPVAAAGTFQVGLPAGWLAWDPAGILNQNANALGTIHPGIGSEYFPGGAAEGNQAALVFLSSGNAAPAGLQQTLQATLQPGLRYTLQVAVGNIASGTSLPGSADGGGTFYNLAGFPGYRIELRAGNSLLAADDNSLDGQIAEGAWATSTLQYSADAGSPGLGQALSIRLINLARRGPAEAPGIEVDFDAVSLVAAPVPEPAGAWLLLGGGALLGLARLQGRRRRD